jgi:hypothetical protein
MSATEDLPVTLAQIREIKDWFYSQAVMVPNQMHPFVEFTGMMSVFCHMVETSAHGKDEICG